MKKHFAFLLCLIRMLSLISCHTNSQNAQETTATTETDSSANNAAMQMYEAAIKEEISVFDERLGEINLKGLRFTNKDTELGSCKLLKKAVLDIDRDGINEFVIQSPDQEHIILRYDNGRVYSYRLDAHDYYRLNTDGTFYWYDSFESSGRACGLSRIVFVAQTLNVKPIYSLEVSANPTKYEYFVEGQVVTGNEYYDYQHDQNVHRKSVKFSQFELACSYPISAQQAWDLANAYWDDQDGCAECSAGTAWTVRIAMIDTPNSETNAYRFAFLVECNSGGGLEGYECMPPHTVREHDQILVNASTGEIVASSYDPDGECISVEQAIEIAQNDCDYIDFETEGNAYLVEHDADAAAPDHFYVIVIQKYYVDHYSAYTTRWVHKYTGEIIAPYYINGK